MANKARVNILFWKGAQALPFLVFIAVKYLSFAWLMAQEKPIDKFLQSSVEGFSTNFRVINAEESILSWSSGDKSGPQSCTIPEPAICVLASHLLASHTCASNLWSYVCTWEKSVCLCVHVCLLFLRIWHKSEIIAYTENPYCRI